MLDYLLSMEALFSSNPILPGAEWLSSPDIRGSPPFFLDNQLYFFFSEGVGGYLMVNL